MVVKRPFASSVLQASVTNSEVPGRIVAFRYTFLPALKFCNIIGRPASGFQSSSSYQTARDVVRRYNSSRMRCTVITTQDPDAQRRAIIHMTPPTRPDDWMLPISRRRPKVEFSMSIGISSGFTTETLHGRPFYAIRFRIQGAWQNRLDRIMSWIHRFHLIPATYLETYPAEMGHEPCPNDPLRLVTTTRLDGL